MLLYKKNSFWGVIIFLFFSLTLPIKNAKAQQSNTTQPANVIQNLQKVLLQLQKDSTQKIENELVKNVNYIQKIYTNRQHRPIFSVGRVLSEKATDCLQCLQNTQFYALNPKNYHANSLKQLWEKNNGTTINFEYIEQLTAFEILALDAFLELYKKYGNAFVQAQTINPDWYANSRKIDLLQYAQNAVNEPNLCETLQNLHPQYTAYKLLQTQLQTAFAYSWDSIPPLTYSQFYQKGDQNDYVLLLKKRLLASGDYPATANLNSNVFDYTLERAVMRFQNRHGIDPDGLVRSRTVNALNVPPKMRYAQVIANLERWRWLPQQLGDSYITINIPNYELLMIKNAQIAYRERVIVGRDNFATPSFKDTLTEIIFNPTWYIPRNIAKNEILPNLKTDKNYLLNNDITVWKGNTQINPNAVNWNTEDLKKYIFKQAPNAFNPMGQVKFIFPNKHEVYLHDTPSKDLFTNSYRSHSHGCMRLHEPLKFAEFLLKNETQTYDSTAIKNILKVQKEQKIKLKKGVPIYIFYFTAFVDSEGMLNFRDDLYQWDEQLYNAIKEY